MIVESDLISSEHYNEGSWLTDEPSEVLIGIDDLDDDLLERLDLQEAKMNQIEVMLK